MAAVGFTASQGSAGPFPIWVVFYVDKFAEEPQRRIAGAFTGEVEARKLLRELRQLEDPAAFQYTVEPAQLYKRNEDWRPDPASPPYDTVPGLKQAKAILPDFKGHLCETVNRVMETRSDGAAETRGLEIGWATGARVQLGVERAGTMLITQEPWSPPSQSPVDFNSIDPLRVASRWSSDPVDADDPLSVFPGERVHGFSVTENQDGSIGAIQVRFKAVTLVVSVQGDQFVVEVVKGS